MFPKCAVQKWSWTFKPLAAMFPVSYIDNYQTYNCVFYFNPLTCQYDSIFIPGSTDKWFIFWGERGGFPNRCAYREKSLVCVDLLSLKCFEPYLILISHCVIVHLSHGLSLFDSPLEKWILLILNKSGFLRQQAFPWLG